MSLMLTESTFRCGSLCGRVNICQLLLINHDHMAITVAYLTGIYIKIGICELIF